MTYHDCLTRYVDGLNQDWRWACEMAVLLLSKGVENSVGQRQAGVVPSFGFSLLPCIPFSASIIPLSALLVLKNTHFISIYLFIYIEITSLKILYFQPIFFGWLLHFVRPSTVFHISIIAAVYTCIYRYVRWHGNRIDDLNYWGKNPPEGTLRGKD